MLASMRRRFFLIFFVTQAELDDRRFFQSRFNIVSSLHRTRGVFLYVRSSGSVYHVDKIEYGPSAEPGIQQVDFSKPVLATDDVMEHTPFRQAFDLAKREDIRYCGRSPIVSEDFLERFTTQKEIVK